MKTRHDSLDRSRAVYKSECSFGTPCAFLILSPKKIRNRGRSNTKALMPPKRPNAPAKPIWLAVGRP
jgi:hypothetical protein